MCIYILALTQASSNMRGNRGATTAAQENEDAKDSDAREAPEHLERGRGRGRGRELLRLYSGSVKALLGFKRGCGALGARARTRTCVVEP